MNLFIGDHLQWLRLDDSRGWAKIFISELLEDASSVLSVANDSYLASSPGLAVSTASISATVTIASRHNVWAERIIRKGSVFLDLSDFEPHRLSR